MGVITSPGYPVSYGSRLTCQWVVRVRPGRKIQFEFTDLDVTSTDAMCQQDYLTVSPTYIPFKTSISNNVLSDIEKKKEFRADFL